MTMLDANDLLTRARTAAGLDDFGHMGFAEGLGVLVRSINDEAGLTPQREALVESQIQRVLVNRLRMQRDLTQHPEIRDEPVLPPLFITSLPRTGSTKLHRMLAASGDFNGLLYWMSYNFAPLPGRGVPAADPRIEAARRYLEWEHAAAPGYQRAHPHYFDEYEEELALLDAGFNSLYQWTAFLDVPSYVEFVLAGDGLQAFRDLRLMLQYLQWQHYRGKQRRWVLKTPSLFGFEAGYSTVFEDTDFIVTHRDPAAIWPSVCSLFCGARALYSDTDYTSVASTFITRNFGQALQGHLAWRASAPAEKVLDLRFEEIVGDEIALLQRVYDWLGMPFTETAQRNVERWLAHDAERGHARNTATPEDFETTAQAVRDDMSRYVERYGAYLQLTEETRTP